MARPGGRLAGKASEVEQAGATPSAASFDLWITPGDEPSPARAAKHGAAAVVRRLTDLAACLDVDALSPAQLELLDGLTRRAETVADGLEALPRLTEGLAAAPGLDHRLSERSGLSGLGNPLAPPLILELGEGRILGRAVYGAAYEGPPGCVHGGFVAAAFDDLLGAAQILSGTAGPTGTLTVRMRRPTPLGVRIDYEAGLTGVEGRKITCWGTASHAGRLLAEADCLFIAPRPGAWPSFPRPADPAG